MLLLSIPGDGACVEQSTCLSGPSLDDRRREACSTRLGRSRRPSDATPFTRTLWHQAAPKNQKSTGIGGPARVTTSHSLDGQSNHPSHQCDVRPERVIGPMAGWRTASRWGSPRSSFIGCWSIQDTGLVESRQWGWKCFPGRSPLLTIRRPRSSPSSTRKPDGDSSPQTDIGFASDYRLAGASGR